jgi:hypothetical protein
MRTALGFEVIRVEPTWTHPVQNDTCGADAYLRGMYEAHHEVWTRVADLASSTARQRVLVLESDFSVATATDEQLRQSVDAAWQTAEVREEKLTSVGWCDNCISSMNSTEDPQRDHRACYGCTTGYLLHSSLAAMLLRNQACMAVETLFKGACFHANCRDCNGTDVQTLQSTLGLPAPVLCSWLFSPPVAPIGSLGGIYRGLFQRDPLMPKGPSAGPQLAQQRSGQESM